MILTFDIGNTNIKVAIFNDGEILQEWRLNKDTNRTGDEYFSIIRTLFREEKIKSEEIQKTVLSSVVPALIGPFVNVTMRLTNKKPLIISGAESNISCFIL